MEIAASLLEVTGDEREPPPGPRPLARFCLRRGKFSGNEKGFLRA